MAGNFTPGEDLPDLLRWKPKDLDGHDRQQVKLPTAEELERVHHDAHREGYEAGYREGMATGYQNGLAKAQAEAERLRMLIAGLESAMKSLEQELGHELLALSLDIAKQMLRQVLKVKPELLLSVIRSAMESLPQNTQHPHIHLHPEDAVLVRELLSAELTHAGWRLVEDPRLGRGGCLIETASAEVDASLPSRWQRIAAALGQNNSWLEDAE
ncbi:MAG TPA: flagellar assembly protein FliH [Novimethylophilus sp.]|jgi:flagellar assembly protein FliH|uniref:flagellar assembly protein FliH n=1 Tax=Novimethylophilus sp. TaxID=2137426 RepID=UPI002F40E067